MVNSDTKNFLKSLFIIFCVYVIYSYYRSRDIYKTEINFIISKIIVNEKSELKLYDNNGKFVPFWGYLITDKDDIKVGDSVHKHKGEKIIYFYRKDKLGRYWENLEHYPK